MRFELLVSSADYAFVFAGDLFDEKREDGRELLRRIKRACEAEGLGVRAITTEDTKEYL